MMGPGEHVPPWFPVATVIQENRPGGTFMFVGEPESDTPPSSLVIALNGCQLVQSAAVAAINVIKPHHFT